MASSPLVLFSPQQALPLELCAEQHGLVTVEQLRDAGIDHDELKWFIEEGRLAGVSPRVLRLVGAPCTEAQRVLGAVLDRGPGSALSHTSALAWWKVPGFTLRELHVTHPGDGTRRQRRLASSLHDVVLPPLHVRVLDGVRVVTPARALFDLASMPRVPPQRVVRAVDNAWSLRLVSGRTMHRMLRELRGRRRAGIAMMREILDERGPDYVPPASGLEGRLIEILKGRGRSPLRRQVDTGDDDGWIGRIDFADPDAPFRLEVQSERFHASLLDRQTDTERLHRLRDAGFVVVTVTETDVWHYPDRVVKLVREGRNQAHLHTLNPRASP